MSPESSLAPTSNTMERNRDSELSLYSAVPSVQRLCEFVEHLLAHVVDLADRSDAGMSR